MIILLTTICPFNTVYKDKDMNINQMVMDLIRDGKTERPVYVYLYERDNDGNVLSKRKYLVEAVFSHNDDEAKICIEQSNLMK